VAGGILKNLNGQSLVDAPAAVAHNPYHPVELDYITLDTICGHDLYLKTDDRYVLYRKRSLPFTIKDKQRLEQTRTKLIYVYCENPQDLRRFYEANLPNIIENKNISSEKKAQVLYQCATGIAQDIFSNPENKENIGKSKDVVQNTMKLLSQGSDAFLQIISLSSHDYYTYTHSVNVMTFTVALLSALGIKDPAILRDAGMGALLHDIGKSKVPLEVLNKPGPLNADEWTVMRKHPSFGFEMLSETIVPERGRDIVIQHHEKINGVGYPYGLKGDSIPLVAQVVSICDAYDAMTTNRCYQKAKKPFDAFAIITKDMYGHFNPSVIEKFIMLLNLKNRK